jgi:hypothetical protein
MAHMTKITLSFEFSVLALTVPGLRLKKSSKYFVLLAICTIFIRLNCRIECNFAGYSDIKKNVISLLIFEKRDNATVIAFTECLSDTN